MARAMATRCSCPPESWRGIVLRAVCQADDAQGGHRALAAFALRQGRQQQRQLDVLDGVQHRDEVIELEDEADVAAAPVGQLALGQRRQIGARDRDLARGDAVDAGDQVQQRRLARAGRAHQRDELALGHVEVDAVEDLDLLRVALIDLAHVLHADGGVVRVDVVMMAPLRLWP